MFSQRLMCVLSVGGGSSALVHIVEARRQLVELLSPSTFTSGLRVKSSHWAGMASIFTCQATLLTHKHRFVCFFICLFEIQSFTLHPWLASNSEICLPLLS